MELDTKSADNDDALSFGEPLEELKNRLVLAQQRFLAASPSDAIRTRTTSSIQARS